ncbi:MAG: hypothetical protein ACFFAN_17700 [Promethearchaeota archaeon]
MKEIEGAYILSGSGGLIFSQENLDKDLKEFDKDYLSNLLSTIETIALKIGEGEVNVIEFGNIKFYHTKDKLTKIGFCLKCKKDVKKKKIFHTLTNLMNIFLEKFTGNFSSPDIVKKEKMDSFILAVSQILGEGKKVEYFLDEIKIE